LFSHTPSLQNILLIRGKSKELILSFYLKVLVVAWIFIVDEVKMVELRQKREIRFGSGRRVVMINCRTKFYTWLCGEL